MQQIPGQNDPNLYYILLPSRVTRRTYVPQATVTSVFDNQKLRRNDEYVKSSSTELFLLLQMQKHNDG